MKSVEFDIPGAADYQPKDMVKHVMRITQDIYGVDIVLTGTDLRNYYRSDGAKITKSLAGLIRDKVPKEVVQANFGTYARLISELYTVGLTLRAEFGDKKLVGEGVYEAAKTCFRSDGENAISKHFIVANRRCAAIVLYQKGKKDAGGRCLAYFAGNRNIYLTNFYWRGIPQNKIYFITALRNLLGIKKVLYRLNPKFYLPIFKNGDSIHVYDERTRPVVPSKKLTCPHCGVSVNEGELYSEESGSYRIVGCSKRCARKNSKIFVECHVCGELVHNGSASQIEDRYYCQPCFKIHLVTCYCCGTVVRKEDATASNGKFICKNCIKKSKCGVCGEIVVNSENAKKAGDTWYCIECLPKSGHMCAVCRTISTKKIAAKRTYGMKLHICEDCASPLPGTIMEAQRKTAAGE